MRRGQAYLAFSKARRGSTNKRRLIAIYLKDGGQE